MIKTENKDDLNLREISTFLIFNEDYEDVNKIEENLKKVIFDKKNTNNFIKEEYYFLYLVAKIKLTPIENQDLRNAMNDYFELIKVIKINSKNDKKTSKKIKSDNNRNIISHLAYIQKLYNTNYFSDINDKINKLKNDLKLDLYKNEKSYTKYIKQSGYKYILWYGQWYFNLAYTTFVTWFIYWFLYYLYDNMHLNWDLIQWSAYEWMKVWPVDQYLFLSLNILSNLGSDTNMAVTPYLRVLFGTEQVLWVIFLWLFIYIFWKKLW